MLNGCCFGIEEEKDERREFLKFFALLFQNHRIVPRFRQKWEINDLFNAIENGTVREVMEIAGILSKSKKQCKELKDQIFEEMVSVRDLWEAVKGRENSCANKLMVYENTPWKYFDAFIQRKMFYEMEYILTDLPNSNGYYIHVKIDAGNEMIKVKEYGIAGEEKSCFRCECDFQDLVLLCPQCPGFVEYEKCQLNPRHEYYPNTYRCFKIQHRNDIKPRIMSYKRTNKISPEIQNFGPKTLTMENNAFTFTTTSNFNNKFMNELEPIMGNDQNFSKQLNCSKGVSDFFASNTKFIQESANAPLSHHYTIPPKYETYDARINGVGIDLGTSSCFAAVTRNKGIVTVPLDNEGERILPSYIGFDEKKVKFGKVVVDHLGTYSKSTVFDIKRIIGRAYPDIERDSTWPFEVIPEGQTVKLKIKNHLGELTTKSPEEITSELLKFIKKSVSDFQNTALKNVVISIPAAFTEKQKVATITAGKLAGWEKIHLLPEPVAASFAYFIDRPLPNNATILLFDLGGGTLDICIFKIFNEKLQVLKSTGDTKLGGRNFDNVLYEYFKKELALKYRLDVEINDRKKYQLMIKSQDIKHSLTARDNDVLYVEDFGISTNDTIQLTRQQFEEKTTFLTETIERLLYCATDGFQQQIDMVFHVGGSCTGMPMIKNLLARLFPVASHRCQEHPDEVVAIGTAYYAYHLEFEAKRMG